VHGTEDPTVLYSGSVEIHARADEIGLTNELMTSEGAAHGFSMRIGCGVQSLLRGVDIPKESAFSILLMHQC
jgi:hypothetical protein